jgi:hypothetical protein
MPRQFVRAEPGPGWFLAVLGPGVRINRGDILLGDRREEVCVGAVDVRCEPFPDRFLSRTSGLDDRLRTRAGRHEHQLRVAVRVGGGVVGDSGYRAADTANGDERRPLRCPDLSKDLKDLGHRFLVGTYVAEPNTILLGNLVIEILQAAGLPPDRAG